MSKQLKSFIPKPFVFSTMVDKGQVFKPKTTCSINKKGEHLCSCVHFCEQFESYETLRWGIKLVPTFIECKFGGFCQCNRLFVNGHVSNKRVQLGFDYAKFKIEPQR